uniref:Uncharacterized protein n=1 Tax=Oryza sativa subsp. japonica TaxID=39947 RepID=Q69K33_ORYSJ|nr:hypothetical protein [Oryza sativa Japonica Group]BAD46561.1 hypothetical protein [Oryza sativa Japonica Group]
MLFAECLLPSSFFGFQLVLDGQLCEEEDVVNCLPKLRKTAGSASEVEEAVKPAVKQE